MRTASVEQTIAERVARIDWTHVERDLDEHGWSRLAGLLRARECHTLAASYDRTEGFRSTIDMERYHFGRGQYRYFAYPLPPIVDALRRSLYPHLHPVANRWAERLGRHPHYPPSLAAFLQRCQGAGQRRPTPLLLRYGPEDYNCLHQDIYGAIAFPLQVLVPLTQGGVDYDGGEVILLEQRPRAQSKAWAITPDRGDAIVFTNRERPARGSRGWYAVQMRHGASPVTRGRRLVLGLIFHDAE